MKKLNNLLQGVLVVGVIVGAVMLLSLQDLQVKNNAIKTCGGRNNITEKYTAQGDTYYVCK